MKKTLSILSILILIILTTSCKEQSSGPSGINPDLIISAIVNIDESELIFTEGDFDPSQIKVTVNYTLDRTEVISLTNEMIQTDVSKLRVGDNTLHVLINDYEMYIKVTINERNDDRFIYESDQLGTCYYISGYVGEDEIVTLPSRYNAKPVIGILDSAFLKDQTLKVVYIPAGYTTIEAAAFYQCTNLKSVYIPNTVKSIGDYALSGVRTIYIEHETNSFSSNWYDDKCGYVYTNIKQDNLIVDGDYQYLLNGTNASIANYLGKNKDVMIPTTYNEYIITNIGAFAFAYDKTIETVFMANSITTIENNAFNNCENLKNVIFSQNLVTLAASSFCYCGSLNDFTLPETLEYIGNNAFNMCTTLTTLTIPANVKTIEYYAFAWCTGLKTLYIHDTLETLGQGAIYSCSKLKMYTEYPKAPNTWHENFNPSNRPIEWNYVIK